MRSIFTATRFILTDIGNQEGIEHDTFEAACAEVFAHAIGFGDSRVEFKQEGFRMNFTVNVWAGHMLQATYSIKDVS